jgi:hypothetical protein
MQKAFAKNETDDPHPFSVNHITSNGQYVGIDIVDEVLGVAAEKTIITVFKIR